MSEKSLVTISQAEAVRKMANEKKVGRDVWQKAMDDGGFSRFLDALKNGTLEFVPPPGARIQIVHIRFNPKRDWHEAINAAGPNTPDSYNVRKVGDQYPPIDGEDTEGDLVLLNFPAGDGNWDKANSWAQGMGLKKTAPREVFAIGEQHPTLHRQLGCNPMYVVATTECSFVGHRHACDVWWRGSEREADLDWVGGFGDSGAWFAFRK